MPNHSELRFFSVPNLRGASEMCDLVGFVVLGVFCGSVVYGVAVWVAFA